MFEIIIIALVLFVVFLLLPKSSTITKEELAEERAKLEKELDYRYRYKIRPPLMMWSKPVIGKDGCLQSIGKIQTNADYIKRWEKEHFNWTKN